MFDISFLNKLRDEELRIVAGDLTPGCRLLEFGAGTGAQARRLAALGYVVTAVDLRSSAYAGERLYPIVDYDGARLPLQDVTIDLIFSSNVLEHVENLEEISGEFARVLSAGGYCVHILPSTAWRAWTLVSGFPSIVPALGRLAAGLLRHKGRRLKADLKVVAACVLPVGHGTASEAFSELWTFSVPAWKRRFETLGFRVIAHRPTGLFHTGHMLFGPGLSLEWRKRLAPVLGSAANIYVVESTLR